MSSKNSKPKTEKPVEVKAEDVKPEVKTDAPAVTESVKADDVKPEVKAEEIDKLALAKKTLDAEKEKEADKQKGIYAAMGKFTIVRN